MPPARHLVPPRRLALALAAVVVLGLVPFEVRAAVPEAGAGPMASPTSGHERTPSAQELVELCIETVAAIPELGPRTCRSAQAVVWGMAAFCRNAGADREACARVDGRVVGEARLAAYEASWVHRAHELQRALDLAAPFRAATIPHTHNSDNASSYDPTLTNQDPNQLYSITDQLRMDIRALELDLHWVPSPHGRAEDAHHAVVLCHGEPLGSGMATVHVGCSVDRPVEDGLREIADFLRAPGNEREVVVLYLENNLRGDATAHRRAAEAIAAELGELVYKPRNRRCEDMPVHLSRADLLAAGQRVLIVGNCGPSGSGAADWGDGGWGDWVHLRGAAWRESGSGSYPTDPAACAEERSRLDYDRNLIRRFEGGTWLQAMEGGGSTISTAQAHTMARCGVNLIGFDHLHPDDPRLAAIIWSWAEGEWGDDPDRRCARQDGDDARFRAGDCAERRVHACLLADGTWRTTSEPGRWRDGFGACATELGGARFGVPVNGWENGLLAAAAGGAGVWLNLHSLDEPGTWVANADKAPRPTTGRPPHASPPPGTPGRPPHVPPLPA